jgi:hypothetical protein
MFKIGDIVKFKKKLKYMPWYTDKPMRITNIFDNKYFVDYFQMYGAGGIYENELYLVILDREEKLKRILNYEK